jgi:hypothetical protein
MPAKSHLHNLSGGWGGGATVQSKQGIPSFGQQLSGHEFSGIYYPSAFRLFLPPLKNSAEKEDLPSMRFPITSLVAGVEKPGATGGRPQGGRGGNNSIIEARNPFFWS